VEETLSIYRIPRAMTIYQFLLGMVLALYVGFSRLNHLRFVAHDPMLTDVLQVGELPPKSTFWRFVASLHLQVAKQLSTLQRVLRQRVWEAAHVQVNTVTLDTDTTVHTLYGHQMGGRKSYNPKNSCARRRLVLIAPGVSEPVAKAIAKKWSELRPEFVHIVLDADPGVPSGAGRFGGFASTSGNCRPDRRSNIPPTGSPSRHH
jgi:Transposase DDE domain group 1